MIDLEKKVYRDFVHTHYGAWPRLDEVTETYNLLKDIEDTYCKHDLELTRQIAEKIEEEKKMKNIKWSAKSIAYNHLESGLTLSLEGTFTDRFECRDLSDIAIYAANKLNDNQDFKPAPWNHNISNHRITTTPNPDRIIPEIKDVIFNGPATIVLWKDGTKTVVKAQEGEIIDYEKGIAMAIAKRMLGNKGSYYDTFTKYLPEEEPTEEV